MRWVASRWGMCLPTHTRAAFLSGVRNSNAIVGGQWAVAIVVDVFELCAASALAGSWILVLLGVLALRLLTLSLLLLLLLLLDW